MHLRRPALLLAIFLILWLESLPVFCYFRLRCNRGILRFLLQYTSAITTKRRLGRQGFPAPGADSLRRYRFNSQLCAASNTKRITRQHRSTAFGTKSLRRYRFSTQFATALSAKFRPGQERAATCRARQFNRLTLNTYATVATKLRASFYFLSAIRAMHTILLSACSQLLSGVLQKM